MMDIMHPSPILAFLQGGLRFLFVLSAFRVAGALGSVLGMTARSSVLNSGGFQASVYGFNVSFNYEMPKANPSCSALYIAWSPLAALLVMGLRKVTLL